MAQTLGLKFELGANIAAFQTAMQDAGKSVTTLKDHTVRMADQMSTKFGLLASKMRAPLAALSSAVADAAQGDNNPLLAMLDSGADAAKTRALALGTAVGAIFAGPLGAAAGAAIGSALGDAYNWLEKFVALKISETVFDSGLWTRMSERAGQFASVLQSALQPALSYLELWKQQVLDAWDKSNSFAEGVRDAFFAALVKPFGVSNDEFNKWIDGIQSAWRSNLPLWERMGDVIEAALSKPMDAAIEKIKAWGQAVQDAYNEGQSTLGKIGQAIKTGLTYPFEGATETIIKNGGTITDWGKKVRETMDATGAESNKWFKKRAGVWKDPEEPAAPATPDDGKGRFKLDPYERLLVKLREQAQLQDVLSAALGKGAGEAARYRAEVTAMAELQRANVVLTEAQRAKLGEYLDRLKEAADRAALSKFQYDLAEGARANFNAQMLEMAALGKTSAEVAAMRFEKTKLLELQKQGIPVTEELATKIRAEAESVGYLQGMIDRAKSSFETMRDSMQVVGRSLESVFSKWTQGATVSFRDMTASILADMAKIAFQKNVIETLFGGGGSFGGNGLIGNGLASIFGGYRANGGPVAAGVPYMVGERGREMFVPKVAGSIVPNNALSKQSAAPVLNLSIDARGATSDAVAALEARMPSLVLSTMHDARDRGMF